MTYDPALFTRVAVRADRPGQPTHAVRTEVPADGLRPYDGRVVTRCGQVWDGFIWSARAEAVDCDPCKDRLPVSGDQIRNHPAFAALSPAAREAIAREADARIEFDKNS